MTEVSRGYKPKTIAKIIENKVESWLKSITDKDLVALIRQSYIVTGGAIASMLLGEPVNDFDIYFSDIDAAENTAAYYLDKFKQEQSAKGREIYSNVQVLKETDRVRIRVKSMGVLEDGQSAEEYRFFEMFPPEELEKYLERIEQNKTKKNNYEVEFISENAISLSGDVQIIIRFVGNPAQIHENFDFQHAMNYYTAKDGLVLNVDSLTSLMSRELRYSGSKYPVCSLFRIRKFLQRGFTINAGEIFKISYDISQLNLSDPLVLEDQLTGVDIAYMHELISILNSDQKNGKNIDRTYIMKVVDRVFG